MPTIILLGVRLTGARSAQEAECRCKRAAAIYHAARRARLILCGGMWPGDDETEAATLRRRLLELGVRPADIIMEEGSHTTMENLINAAALTEDGEEIVVVTSDYHGPRVRLIARRRAISAQIRVAPIPFSAYKCRRIIMETLYLLDIVLGHQDPGAKRPAWTRLVMKLLRQEKP